MKMANYHSVNGSLTQHRRQFGDFMWLMIMRANVCTDSINYMNVVLLSTLMATLAILIPTTPMYTV